MYQSLAWFGSIGDSAWKCLKTWTKYVVFLLNCNEEWYAVRTVVVHFWKEIRLWPQTF